MNVSCGSQHCKCGFTLIELNKTKTKTDDNTAILQIGIREKEKNKELFLSLIQKNKGKENKQLRVGERQKMVMGRKL